jgi:hypothetical protein
MLGSPVLGTAVGLVLLFATMALLCSGITEWLSNVFQMRAKYLLTGMRAMLDGPDGGGGDGPNVVGRCWAYLQTFLRVLVGLPPPATDPAAAPATTGRGAWPEPDPATGRMRRVKNAGLATHRRREALTAQAKRQRRPAMNVHDRVKEPACTSAAVTTVHALAADSPRPREPVLTTALWASPLLRSLQSRRINGVGSVRNPQYVSGRSFARALVDLLVATDGAPPAVLEIEHLRAGVERLPTALPLRAQLLALLAHAGTDVEAFVTSVEQWYDEQMAKMAGWYKRWSRVILGVVGFLVAVLVNVDTVQVAHSLYVDTPLQQSVVATANAGTLCQSADAAQRRTCVDEELRTLQVAGIPFGYPTACPLPALSTHMARCWSWSGVAELHAWDFPLKLLGWLVTAFAVSFGAPFWFEALSRLGSLRNTGTKPSSSTSG